MLCILRRPTLELVQVHAVERVACIQTQEEVMWAVVQQFDDNVVMLTCRERPMLLHLRHATVNAGRSFWGINKTFPAFRGMPWKYLLC